MIRSTDCERNYHHLCDGWYGHQTHECECLCHGESRAVEPEDDFAEDEQTTDMESMLAQLQAENPRGVLSTPGVRYPPVSLIVTPQAGTL